jgi:hypothetical protein
MHEATKRKPTRKEKTMKIDPALLKHMSIMTQDMLSKLPPEDQERFAAEFKEKMIDPATWGTIAVLFPPIAYFKMGEIPLAILFFATFGGCGIWWMFELGMVKNRVAKYNDRIAGEIIQTLKFVKSE